MSIDYDSRETAFKILIIIFIIATIIINLMLLIKYIRVPGFLNIPGICMKMTVAAGSIFLALFSYVVLAKVYFEDYEDLKCRSVVTSSIYMTAFLPFVFGCCIILQCCYLYFRNNFPSTLNPKIQSIAIAGIPWIFGILIVCPLTMAGTEWEENCRRDFTLSRFRAIVVITVLLPACIAVIFSIIISYKQTTPYPANVYQHQAGAVTISQNATVTTSYPTQPHGVDSPPEYKENQNTNQYPQQYPHQQPQANPQQYPQQYPQQQPQANLQQYPPQYAHQYPQQYLQGYPQPYPQQYPNSGPIDPNSSQLQLTDGSTVMSPQSIVSEKRCLVRASLIFFFSVMPWACFNLGYILNTDRSTDLSRDGFIIINDVCTWLLYIYPTLVPLLWRQQIV